MPGNAYTDHQSQHLQYKSKAQHAVRLSSLCFRWLKALLYVQLRGFLHGLLAKILYKSWYSECKKGYYKCYYKQVTLSGYYKGYCLGDYYSTLRVCLCTGEQSCITPHRLLTILIAAPLNPKPQTLKVARLPKSDKSELLRPCNLSQHNRSFHILQWSQSRYPKF